MPLKPSEILFNFPVRLYEHIDDEEHESNAYLLNKPSKRVPRYVKDMVAVPIDSIHLWGATFSKHDDFDIVIKEGADATIVYLKDETEFFCHWNKKKFEAEYNAHIEKLQKELKDDPDYDFIEINDDNIRDIEAAVKHYKKFKKEEKLKLKQDEPKS